MKHDGAPLVGTLRFVFLLGITFAVAWLGMYALRHPGYLAPGMRTW